MTGGGPESSAHNIKSTVLIQGHPSQVCSSSLWQQQGIRKQCTCHLWHSVSPTGTVNYCRHAELVTNFHNFIQITVNQYVRSYIDCVLLNTRLQPLHIHTHTWIHLKSRQAFKILNLETSHTCSNWCFQELNAESSASHFSAFYTVMIHFLEFMNVGSEITFYKGQAKV